MNKILLIFIVSTFSSLGLLSQTIEKTTYTIKLIKPTDSEMIKQNDSLIIHLTPLSVNDSTEIPTKIVAKRIKSNVYEFSLPKIIFYIISFEIGNFGKTAMCIDNTTGEAFSKQSFTVLLDTEFQLPQFTPPCFELRTNISVID